MNFQVKALLGGIGKEVVGLSLEGDIPTETAHQLRDVWLDAGILLFRGIGTSPEALLKLSRCFGELEPHPIEKFRLKGYPELILLTNQAGLSGGPVYRYDGVDTYGRIPWHVDLAFTTTPNAGALLRMVQKTETGGWTGWLDTALAYDELDQATKDQIQNLEVRYVFRTNLADMRFNNPGGVRISIPHDLPKFPPVAHPLVWTHPETGRKILNVSTLNMEGIVGMEQKEGDKILQKLVDHALQPKFQYIHHWENNDMVLWDNRRTLHMASGHPVDQIRIVQRTTIKGTVPMGRVIEEEKEAANL